MEKSKSFAVKESIKMELKCIYMWYGLIYLLGHNCLGDKVGSVFVFVLSFVFVFVVVVVFSFVFVIVLERSAESGEYSVPVGRLPVGWERSLVGSGPSWTGPTPGRLKRTGVSTGRGPEQGASLRPRFLTFSREWEKFLEKIQKDVRLWMFAIPGKMKFLVHVWKIPRVPFILWSSTLVKDPFKCEGVWWKFWPKLNVHSSVWHLMHFGECFMYCYRKNL